MASFGDQFLEYVGISTEDFLTQPDPFSEFKLEPVCDPLLEHVGISADLFCSQPDPFLSDIAAPPPASSALQEHVGISEELFCSQPDPFVVDQKADIAPPGRFAAPVSAAALEEKVASRIPKKTQQATKWGKTVWDDWAHSRNSRRTVGDIDPRDPYHIVPTVLLYTTADEMNFWLARFVFEIRRMDGKPYPAKTLYGLVAALMRHFREDLGRHDLNFLDRKDIRFAEFRKALDARMKELTAEGVGLERRQADPLTAEDEDKLWASGAISTETSTGLSHGVFFYNCKIFGLRGMDEHRRLQVEQYKFGTDVSGRYMQYTGRVSKNVQGGLNHRQVDVKSIKQHADNSNPRCVVNLFETYINSLPDKHGSFYRRPLAKSTVPKFSLQVVGRNNLSTYIKTMCAKAGVSMEGRNITNHSGKVTCATQMFAAGFDEQTIMSRTGHRSNAVRAYKRPSSTLLQDVSNSLQPPKPMKTDNTCIANASPNKHRETTTTTSTSTVLASPQPTTTDTSAKIGSRLSISHPNGLKIVLDL